MEDLSKIILGTGNYENVKSGNMVSITGDGGNAWGYFGPTYKKLAPRLLTYLNYAEKLEKLLILEKNPYKIKQYLDYRKKIEDEYIESYYETRLRDLDAKELLLTLNDKFGNDIILLCHEDILEFCHRRLVADYIELKAGLYIPEVSINNEGKIKKLVPISYKDRLINVMKK